MKTHNYTVVEINKYVDPAVVANLMANRGWRVVAALNAGRPDYSGRLMFERPVGISHPDDGKELP